MKDDPIPDNDHVARYCSPMRVEDDLPLATAFEINLGHDYLSVNWLEYWGPQDVAVALECVREEFDLERKRDGRFAVLDVARAKGAVERKIQGSSSVTHQPTKAMDSHAGIFGFTQSDFDVAVELANEVRPEDVFPAIIN